MAGNFLPKYDNIMSLGTSASKWNNIYLSGVIHSQKTSGDILVNLDSNNGYQVSYIDNQWKFYDGLQTFYVGDQIIIPSYLYSFGDNSYGQLGSGSTLVTNNLTPINYNTTKWKTVSSGGYHSLGLDSSGYLFSWGSNTCGELGNGTTISQFTPLQIGTTKWGRIGSNLNYSIGIAEDGTLYHWGKISDAWVTGTTVYQYTPLQISNSKWKNISCGCCGILAIDYFYHLFAFGQNGVGQLCTGNAGEYLSSFTQIGSTKWSDIDLAINHVLLTTLDGYLFGCGCNIYGQLGNESTTTQLTPIQIGTSKWVDICTQLDQSYGISSDNQYLYSWGCNISGQLGNGTTLEQHTPLIVGNSKWRKIFAGWYYTMGLDTNNYLFGWGNNTSGQTGIGLTSDVQYTPIQIGSSKWYFISCGINHALALVREES